MPVSHKYSYSNPAQSGPRKIRTYSKYSPFLNRSVLLPNRLHQLRNSARSLWWQSRRLEKISQLLLFVLIIRWVPADVCCVSLEEIGNKDEVFVVFIGIGNDICALKGLGKVAKNIVDQEDGFCCICGAGDIYRGLAEVKSEMGKRSKKRSQMVKEEIFEYALDKNTYRSSNHRWSHTFPCFHNP